MHYLLLTAPALALLLVAAHVLRGGPVLLVVLCLGLAALVFVRHRNVPRLVIAALVVATAEWLRTLWALVGDRLEAGAPWMRLSVILGAVSLATALSTLVFRAPAVRRYYDGAPPRGPLTEKRAR